LVRGQKVMTDADLAKLYQVETKELNRAVLRNVLSFPDDFMISIDAGRGGKFEVPNWHLKGWQGRKA